MKTIFGTSNWITDINLSTGMVTSYQVSVEDRRDYLGGKGLGLKLLQERMDRGIDPLGEDNILAFMTGALMGTGAPCTDGFSAVTKSPLTGFMLHASCGGPFGMACKTTGYDGLLVRGRAAEPAVIVIAPAEVRITDGTAFWGLDINETQRRLNIDGKAGVVAIGPAGENQVLIANAGSGHHFFGRGGLGAVMGAKNLKAIVARGNAYHIKPVQSKRFVRTKKRVLACIDKKTWGDDDPRDFNLSGRVHRCNMGGILPVFNFQKNTHPLADQVLVENLEQRYPRPTNTCLFGSGKCFDAGSLPGKRADQIPDYSSIGMLGPNLGIFDADAMVAVHDRCNRLGLDCVSAGAVLAWCMEAGEKGLIDTPLKFGQSTGIDAALEDMAYRRGFGDAMASGTRSLANRYGGKHFAMQVKGLEIPAYDSRGAWGLGLACAVGSGDENHLAPGMADLEVVLGLLDPKTIRAKARWVKFLEDFYAAAASLWICPYTAQACLVQSSMVRWMPKWLLAAIMHVVPVVAISLVDVGRYARLWRSVTGLRLNRWQLLKAGARIQVLERAMNVGEGVSRKDDTLPRRFLSEEPTDDEAPRRVPLQPMLDAYYRLRGYDLRGVPSPRTCKHLGGVLARSHDAIPRQAGFAMVSPGPHRLKRLYLAVVLWFVGRAIEAAFKVDRQVRQQFDAVPDEFTFALNIASMGPAMVMTKDKRGKVSYLDANIKDRYIDLTLTIKSIDTAMLLFTFREAIVTAVARDRLIVNGDIPIACSVVRILERVLVDLLPKGLASLSVRRYPGLSMMRRTVGRGLIYLRALAGI